MSKEKIILVGGGGHCKSVIDVIEAQGKFDIAGIIDVKEKVGQTILGYKIIGSDEDIVTIATNYKNFHISLGFIKSNTLRVKIYNDLKALKVNLPVIVSPTATVSKYATIGDGTIVMHQVVVNAGANIGENCIINTRAIIEHEVILEGNCHISTGAIVNGNCTIFKNCFIGSNSVLNNNIQIASKCLIGAGAVINRNIDTEGVTVVGNPGRILKK